MSLLGNAITEDRMNLFLNLFISENDFIMVFSKMYLVEMLEYIFI